MKAYYFPFPMPDQSSGFVYLLCPPEREEELHRCIRQAEIPTFATVIVCGQGKPDERLCFNMERYYGLTIREQEAA